MNGWAQLAIALATVIISNIIVVLFKAKEHQILLERDWETNNSLFEFEIGILCPEDKQLCIRLSANLSEALFTLAVWSFYLKLSWTKLR